MIQATSATDVDNRFVVDVYARLASVYDWFFGRALQPGRIAAIRGIPAGASVLEVGIGTRITIPMYPPACVVTGIDLSAHMLEKAARRLATQPNPNVRLLQMDAAAMSFPDQSFDVVHAPYLISVVPDPVKVAREMWRVCRPDGRVLLLNHFLSANGAMAWLERRIAPLAVHLGFNSAVDTRAFLAETPLNPLTVAKVNYPSLWSLVTCVRDVGAGGERLALSQTSWPDPGAALAAMADHGEPVRDSHFMGRVTEANGP